MTHELKCWPEFFWPLKDGRKRFELRRDDHGFAVGDELVIRAWSPTSEEYLDEKPLVFSITYIFDANDAELPGPFGSPCVLDPDYVILGLGPA